MTNRGEQRDQAALYALGCLSLEESEEFRHKLHGTLEIEAAVREFQQTLQALSALEPDETPPETLKQRLLTRIRASVPDTPARTQPWKQWRENAIPSGVFTLQGNREDWQDTDCEGVSVKKLFLDQARDRVTMLVKMAPGSVYPGHEHYGPEECFVLEGDLQEERFSMKAGDYQRADRGSMHGAQFSESGCLLLITSSLQDRLLETI